MVNQFNNDSPIGCNNRSPRQLDISSIRGLSRNVNRFGSQQQHIYNDGPSSPMPPLPFTEQQQRSTPLSRADAISLLDSALALVEEDFDDLFSNDRQQGNL